MIGTATKEPMHETINNPPYTRLKTRAQGRSMKIPIPAMSPTMPVARTRRGNAKRAMGNANTPNRNNSYIKARKPRTKNSPLRMPRPPKKMLTTAIAVMPPVRCLSTLVSCYRMFYGDIGRRKNSHSAYTEIGGVDPSSIERQHGPCYLTGFHRAEGFVDVAEAPLFGDHRVEVEPTLFVEFEVMRDVDPEPVRSHARGLDAAFGADRHPRKLDGRIGRQHADDRRGAADRQALDRLAAELGVADRLEGVIDAGAAGQGTHRLDGIVLGGVDEMRRADAQRHLALRLEHVDRDDLARAADPRALDD